MPRSKALRMSVIMFGITLAGAIALAQLGVAPAWRLAFFPAFFVATYTSAMALGGTCGFMAMSGLRDMGEGPEKIADPTALREARRVGRRVIASGVAAALAMTAGIALV